MTRLLDEDGRFSVLLPGQTSIDITPDVIAVIDEANRNLTNLTGSNPVQTPTIIP